MMINVITNEIVLITILIDEYFNLFIFNSLFTVKGMNLNFFIRQF